MGCICVNLYFILSDLCRTRRGDGPQQPYVTPVGASALGSRIQLERFRPNGARWINTSGTAPRREAQ